MISHVFTAAKQAILTAKKHLSHPCSRGLVERIASQPEAGFAWPYYLYTPRQSSQPSHAPHRLLVVPINTGTVSDDPDAVDEYARDRQLSRYRNLAEALNVPLLVPAFPRPASHPHLYTHALDRDSLLTKVEGLQRVDLQLIAMIDHARELLAGRGIPLAGEVLLTGFSTAGMFANRFTLLHPRRVWAAAVGSPGGWPIAPVSEYHGRPLPYPVGIDDLPQLTGRAFDLKSFRQLPLLFFMGEQDENDSVPYQDGYDPEHQKLVFELFGDSPLARWPKARHLYEEAGADARFRIYEGVGHQLTDEMRSDVARFLQDSLVSHSHG